MNVHIHAPLPKMVRVRILKCPTCERRRKMLVVTYEWYDPSVTCLTCGEQWNGGEMVERPFAPGWRRKNVEQARKMLERWPA